MKNINGRMATLTFVAMMIMSIHLFLVPALFGGLLVYSFASLLSSKMQPWAGRHSRLLASITSATAGIVTIVGVIVAGAVSMSAWGQDSARVTAILEASLESLRGMAPHWILVKLPIDASSAISYIARFLSEHAGEVGTAGADAIKMIIQVIIGIVIGAMVSVNSPIRPRNPFLQYVNEHFCLLSRSFSSILSAQLRISLMNTSVTALYLYAILPLFDITLPMRNLMVVATFAFGLLPIIGNIISNSIICLISLSVSPVIMMYSLLYLVVIHKLEYFFSARITGGRIGAKAWELLAAMLVMESMFGVMGLLAAPVFYAWGKSIILATDEEIGFKIVERDVGKMIDGHREAGRN